MCIYVYMYICIYVYTYVIYRGYHIYSIPICFFPGSISLKLVPKILGIHGYCTKQKNSRDGKPDLKKHGFRGHDCLEEWNELKKKRI